jgi:hypothetical protein
MTEEIMTANLAKTDVKFKELTETIKKIHLEYEEPTSLDMKECQETTICHEPIETDTEKIQPDPGMMQSIAEHQEAPK